MAEKVATLGAVVINVVDMDRERDFWTSVLGVEVGREIPGFFLWLRPQQTGGISVALQKVDEPKEGRNRLHLDTAVDDLDAAQGKIEALGGTHVETHEVPGFSWRVMADPEGNEFCIARRTET
jgi:predicted enzyme related to lactoylglutathione lyase